METVIIKKWATPTEALLLATGTKPELVSLMRGTRYADGFEDCRYLYEGNLQVDEYRDCIHIHDGGEINVRVLTN